METTRIVIMGAAGRDFHDFLTRYRDDPSVEVVAFTATQIPGIDDRMLPESLAGPRYPGGIEILPESRLEDIIRTRDVDQVVFAYSDVSHEQVMHAASRAAAAGADFVLLSPESTQVSARVPVLSVCAVRTGVGKSAITRAVCAHLIERGLNAVAIRHPMPYRDLERQAVERFETHDDLEGLTIEEREEYEPLVERGIVVFAGVDYAAIVERAQEEADVIVWDGGNNDTPFVASDLEIVALDPHRAGHELAYHPGETNFLRADVLVVNKVDSAAPEDVQAVLRQAAAHNPDATVVQTSSQMHADDASLISGKRVLVVEDGPTVTHGGMAFGAGRLTAERHDAASIIDPRPFAKGSLADVFAENPHLSDVLPAVGYSPAQLAELEATIAASDAEVVVIGTPVDLSRIIDIAQPTVRVTYDVLAEGSPTLSEIVDGWGSEMGLA
jgi:predicted GTPase